MKLSPLQLNGCYFSEVSIKANASAKSADVNKVEVSVNVRAMPSGDNPRYWYVFLDITINPQEGVVVPYFGQISAMGSFSVDDKWSDNQIERLVYINGAGLLYCSSREMVFTITSKGWFNALSLPSWSFYETYKEFDEQRKLQPELSIDPAGSASIDPPPTAL